MAQPCWQPGSGWVVSKDHPSRREGEEARPPATTSTLPPDSYLLRPAAPTGQAHLHLGSSIYRRAPRPARLANIWRLHCHRRPGKQSPFALAPGNQAPRGEYGLPGDRGVFATVPAGSHPAEDPYLPVHWGLDPALSNRRKIKFHAILTSGVAFSKRHPASAVLQGTGLRDSRRTWEAKRGRLGTTSQGRGSSK